MFEELKPHLAELRKRLLISIATIFVMFVISFGFWEHILDWMIMPLKEALPPGSNVIFTKVGEAFFTALKVSFFAALIFSLPVIFWQLWLFIAPGLYEHEKKFVLPFVISATTMFVLGALFAYYVVFPFGFSYLINFGSQLFTALPSIGEYVGFFTKLMFGFGLAFELPVITFFLASLGLVTDESLKSFFKYAIIIIFAVAALLTPPDVLSQLLMAGPLVILYGVSIIIARIINPASKNEEEIEEADEEEA
ncbi:MULTISPECIES: twin-arginine translocase subunit TatC [Nitratiruptor]|uniref:Sec-independent protein translocase protein TatC n=1 Tax=Nitratiruptor tergarcus DSM 16512 TaxID=1069081 RepID=A0A1W1WUI3_9BACT|nr:MULTISPECIES: twin-arginine translocase subunit TatC [Nitratiruptor]BCD61963.1 sec-independent protein translocase protein TatC [Nitratiruptor sp. YY08-13]BCD65898.1 sec-independent protein translocase protein TatC [Nitratiruptor sp. YY08-26]SMC09393.1 Sec-independent protein translocase TatC [Nitratiruptor tergarcus DSM 16512]